MVAELSRKAESPLRSDPFSKVGSEGSGNREAEGEPMRRPLRNWHRPPIPRSKNRSSSSPHQGVRGTRGSQAHFKKPRNHLQGSEGSMESLEEKPGPQAQARFKADRTSSLVPWIVPCTSNSCSSSSSKTLRRVSEEGIDQERASSSKDRKEARTSTVEDLVSRASARSKDQANKDLSKD